MIRHIVMWNVRGDTAIEKQQSIDLIRDLFHGLRGRIDGLVQLEIGVDASRIDYACDVVLYSEFETWESLNAYAEHSLHLQIRDELAGVRTARHQVDYEF